MVLGVYVYMTYMYRYPSLPNTFSGLVVCLVFSGLLSGREIDPMVKVHGYPSPKARWSIEDSYKPIITW